MALNTLPKYEFSMYMYYGIEVGKNGKTNHISMPIINCSAM